MIEQTAFIRDSEEAMIGAAEQRAAPRFTLLIRPAKLVCGEGEFVCVIRDVSADGVSIRVFHDLPPKPEMAIELQTGETYPVRHVWTRDSEAGCEFCNRVNVREMVSEVGKFPKRQLRLPLIIPAMLGQSERLQSPAMIHNLSQQGARIEVNERLSIGQSFTLSARNLPTIRAIVCWREEEQYGVVFENTFSLRDFARLVASIQRPDLISDIH